MKRSVKRVMDLIHRIAYQETADPDLHAEFLEDIEYEIDKELEADWHDEDSEE